MIRKRVDITINRYENPVDNGLFGTMKDKVVGAVKTGAKIATTPHRLAFKGAKKVAGFAAKNSTPGLAFRGARFAKKKIFG